MHCRRRCKLNQGCVRGINVRVSRTAGLYDVVQENINHPHLSACNLFLGFCFDIETYPVSWAERLEMCIM